MMKISNPSEDKISEKTKTTWHIKSISGHKAWFRASGDPPAKRIFQAGTSMLQAS
jgi:hypothetical protein